MAARIELVEDHQADPARYPSARPHHLRVVAANGETVITSEGYATRSAARRAARTLNGHRSTALPIVLVTPARHRPE